MRIGLNLLYLIPGNVGGTQTYAVSLIEALATIDSENEYYLFLNQESSKLALTDAPNFHRVVCRFHATRRPVRYAWEQLILPLQLHYYRTDLVHSLGYVGPLMSICPSIVTIHDLNYIALQDVIPVGKRRILQFFSTQSARRAAHVITDSHFSKTEIVRFLRLDPGKVTVTHLGPGWNFVASPSNSWNSVQEHYNLPNPYVVAFGGRSAHKNVSRLIKAFSKACENLPHYLVLIGHLPRGLDLTAEALAANLPDRVITLGYLPKAHVAPVLKHADLFVVPSLYEGFGLPVLEAQQAGVPVACSTAASLPEVAGEGAVFFDPYSIDDIARVIRKCLKDTELHRTLVQKGCVNLARFSWENTAKDTLIVYQNVLARRKQ